MRSTYSAAWPSIVQVCIDQNGDEWERDLGDCETSHLTKEDARNSNEFHGNYNETPHLFEIDPHEGEEMIANAVLWAAATELLEFAQWIESLSPSGPILDRAREVIAKATRRIE